jgi:pyroglutamyl-peptidase
LLPDARGFRPRHSTIAPRTPSSRNGNAPFAKLLGAARSRAVPARLSRDAGRYLCNYAYWHALERGGGSLVQFVHIPSARLTPRRRSKRPLPSLAALAGAAEAILIALVAASRR